MKIAIASCFNASIPGLYETQPVWNNVGSKQPDVLVLLGDSIYLDIPWVDIPGSIQVHPQEASAEDFLRHGLQRYRNQLERPEFRKLIRSVPHTYAIWDDHDFLWNDAGGDSLSPTLYGGHI